MATKKISELTELTSPVGTEELIVNDSGTSKKITHANLGVLPATVSQTEAGYLDGVTSSIQTQLGTKLPLAGGTMTGTIAGFTSTGIDDNATSTAITIDASENVGIGTTSPTKNLHLSVPNPSTVGATMRLENRNLSAVAGTPIGTIDFYSNDADGAHISSFIKGIAQEAYGRTGALTFGVSQSYTADATEAMRIDSAGDVKVNTGNLVIGTSGKGIDFSADGNASGMTSEVLDDYEEGTWTPTLVNGGTVSAINKATYTKIGRLVTAYLYINFTPTNDSSQFRIGGLPFTNSGINYYAGGSLGYSGGLNTSDWASPLVETFGTNLYMHNGANGAFILNSAFGGAVTALIIQVTYEAA